MFIGHFGIGMGAKKTVPKASLGTLFLAAQLLDLLWPTFLLLGWEHFKIEPGNTKMTPLNFTDYPLSHSLLMALVWGALFAFIYFLIKKRKREAIVLGLLVVSHWVLDLLVHRPDLPLYPGHSPLVGFGLWNFVPAAIFIEGLIFVLGVYFYVRSTQAKDKVGSIGFWALVVFLVVTYAGNVFGPPPTDPAAIAWVGESQWLIVLWGYWVDRHRTAKLPGTKAAMS